MMHGILYYSTISGNTALVGEALQGFFAHAGISLILQDLAEDSTWREEQGTKSNSSCVVDEVQHALLRRTEEQSDKLGEKSEVEDGRLKIGGLYNFVILGCGTYGHGQLEKSMRKCLEETWKEKKLKNLPCAAIGLGDHRYDPEYNTYAADLLESWIREHSGNLISPPLRINRSPVKPNNTKIIENWARSFIHFLEQVHRHSHSA